MSSRDVSLRWTLVEALAAHQYGVVADGQVEALGVPPSTLRSWRHRGRLWVPAQGVVAIAGAPPSWRQHLMVATLSHGGRTVVVSHRSAARLHGLDGVDGAWLEVTSQRGSTPKLDEVVVHTTDSLGPEDVTFVDGIRVTSVARTLCDIGAVVDGDTVARMLDDALRRGFRRRWIEQTLQRAERPGPTGTATLRRLLDRRDLDGRPDTWFERIVLRQLAAIPDVGTIVPQHAIHDDGGRVVAFVDAALVDWRIAVEAHSKRWHFGDRKNVLDADRDARLAALGWETVYVRHSHARTRGAVAALVAPVIGSRAQTVTAGPASQLGTHGRQLEGAAVRRRATAGRPSHAGTLSLRSGG
jgi:predicted transcriptional regulator of viral defense system